MGIFASLFGSRSKSQDRVLAAADGAIVSGRAGAIPVQEMLRELTQAKIVVPLAGEPTLAGDRVVRWSPATAARSDGHQFLIVFTNYDRLNEFVKSSPEYSYAFLVSARWVLGVLPEAHGLLFNGGDGANGFVWSADGVAAYRRDVLRDA